MTKPSSHVIGHNHGARANVTIVPTCGWGGVGVGVSGVGGGRGVLVGPDKFWYVGHQGYPLPSPKLKKKSGGKDKDTDLQALVSFSGYEQNFFFENPKFVLK